MSAGSTCPTRGYSLLTRATAAVVLLSLLPACAVRRWRSQPVTSTSLARWVSPGATVRLPTASGRVTLRVVRFAFPLVEGVPEPDTSEVVFPVRHAAAEVRTKRPDGAYQLTLHPDAVVVPPNELVGRDVLFSTPEGTRLALRVRALDEGLVHGLPIACWGGAGVRCTATIVVDLSETTSIRVRDVAWGGVTGNLLLVGLVVLVGVILQGLAHFNIE